MKTNLYEFIHLVNNKLSNPKENYTIVSLQDAFNILGLEYIDEYSYLNGCVFADLINYGMYLELTSNTDIKCEPTLFDYVNTFDTDYVGFVESELAICKGTYPAPIISYGSMLKSYQTLLEMCVVVARFLKAIGLNIITDELLSYDTPNELLNSRLLNAYRRRKNTDTVGKILTDNLESEPGYGYFVTIISLIQSNFGV